MRSMISDIINIDKLLKQKESNMCEEIEFEVGDEVEWAEARE